jgi:ABC-type multidrug transport system ATPase subunit
LLASPGLLILDEPFSGLDRQSRAELPLAIEEVRAAGGIVIVSDHQNGLADLPRTLRLTVENHTAEIPAETASADRDGPAAHAVIEVRVEPGEAEAVLHKLRAEGYRADLQQVSLPVETNGEDPASAETGRGESV